MQRITKLMVRGTWMAVCGISLSMYAAHAQAPDGPPPPPPNGQMQGPPGGGNGGRGGMNPERQLERMQKELNLTPDQATQIKSIMAAGRAKMEAERSDTGLSQEDRRAQGMANRQEEQARIKAVLTPEQQSKLAAMEAQRRERMQERGPGGSGGPPPPPPPPPPATTPQ